jgi:hypothetical protein
VLGRFSSLQSNSTPSKSTIPLRSFTLQGNFTASGGLGNDVEAFVLSEADFVNWQNGHPAKTRWQEWLER